jgi:hypothetical protein
MPSLSLNIGLNNGRKLPFGGGAAPSGIPVASTSQIIVVSTNSFITSGLFDKQSASYFQSSVDEYEFLEYVGSDRWAFHDSGTEIAFAISPAGYIPTSGYTILNGGGSFTITAA